MAAQAGQPPVSPDHQGPREPPGPVPAVPLSLRRAPAGRPGPGRAPRGAGYAVRVRRPRARGSAPSGRCRDFLLRPAGVRGALSPLEAEPVPAVLQPLLPSGVAAGHRARAAVAAAGAPGAAATPGRPVPRALSSLIGMGRRPRRYVGFHCPRRRRGREGTGTTPGPPLPFSDPSPTGARAMDPCPSGRVIPVRLDELGDRFRRYRLRVPQAVQALAQSLRRWGQCAPIVATVRDERPQVLDGFTRWEAARQVRGMTTLLVRLIDVDDRR